MQHVQHRASLPRQAGRELEAPCERGRRNQRGARTTRGGIMASIANGDKPSRAHAIGARVGARSCSPCHVERNDLTAAMVRCFAGMRNIPHKESEIMNTRERSGGR